ncbi:hypothetical protein, partial [Albidovulum sp.]|uniref:hypothetical protein n=1 Tax=Albidovulum sp. TaxID=1872424 RepID=UPI0039B8A53A
GARGGHAPPPRMPGAACCPPARPGAGGLHRIVNSQEFDILRQNFATFLIVYKTHRKSVNKFTKKSF